MSTHKEAPVPSEEAREEVGNATTSRKRPPNPDERGPVQAANASRQDKVPTDPQDQKIDPESMYDRRPEEDKHDHPG